MEKIRSLSKREIRNRLFGILAMTDAFIEEGSMVGGGRKEELVKYLPKQIASSIMNLQDLIEESDLSQCGNQMKSDSGICIGCKNWIHIREGLGNCVYLSTTTKEGFSCSEFKKTNI